MSNGCSDRVKQLFAASLVRCIYIFAAGVTPFLGAAAKGGAMDLTSPAFQSGAAMPRKHTCDADDISPRLGWSDVPAGTKSFALIVDDPDAPGGTWVHWVVYDLPADTNELAEGVTAKEILPNHAKQGINDFRKVGYGGPCPPPGRPHRYSFRLYALSEPTNLKPRATKAQLLAAMKGHILAQAELIGRYQR